VAVSVQELKFDAVVREHARSFGRSASTVHGYFGLHASDERGNMGVQLGAGLQGKINGMGQYDGETARECGPRQDSGCVSAARWPVLAK
jgi:hypothetical protein